MNKSEFCRYYLNHCRNFAAAGCPAVRAALCIIVQQVRQLTFLLTGTTHETAVRQEYNIFTYSGQNFRKPPKTKDRK
jgi:hypothetical protein